MKIKKNLVLTITLAITLVLGVATVFVANSTKDVTIAEIPKLTEQLFNLDKDIEIPMSESSLALYQGVSTTELMSIDLTFTKLDVPDLIDNLNSSNYKAVYLDNDMYLRVTNDNIVQVSSNNGVIWNEFDTVDIDAKEFAIWLLQNDPNPGYSIKEIQNRLDNGAEVKHMIFENGKEIYMVVDENGVQLELVQAEKLDTVLLDGQRMMVTSNRGMPMHISRQKLELFYSLLVSNDILTNALAEQYYFECINHIEKNNIYFTLLK